MRSVSFKIAGAPEVCSLLLVGIALLCGSVARAVLIGPKGSEAEYQFDLLRETSAAPSDLEASIFSLESTESIASGDEEKSASHRGDLDLLAAPHRPSDLQLAVRVPREKPMLLPTDASAWRELDALTAERTHHGFAAPAASFGEVFRPGAPSDTAPVPEANNLFYGLALLCFSAIGLRAVRRSASGA